MKEKYVNELEGATSHILAFDIDIVGRTEAGVHEAYLALREEATSNQLALARHLKKQFRLSHTIAC